MKIKCWKCGKEIEYDLTMVRLQLKNSTKKYTKLSDTPSHVYKRVFCETCGHEFTKEKERIKEEYINLKIKTLFERAVGNLEKQELDIYKYEEAIKAVEEYAIENSEKFDSSYEMIAAIILIKNRIEVKMQYKIGRYRVDFYLPDYECILEIDGERHSAKQVHDSKRDVKIRELLGNEWEIIRIPTKYLDENAKMLAKAVIELKKDKQRIRAKNQGIIPSYYSKRNEANAYIKQ